MADVICWNKTSGLLCLSYKNLTDRSHGLSTATNPCFSVSHFGFFSSFKNLKQFKVFCVNIFKKLYLLDTEIIVGRNFLLHEIFFCMKFSIFQFAPHAPSLWVSKVIINN